MSVLLGNYYKFLVMNENQEKCFAKKAHEQMSLFHDNYYLWVSCFYKNMVSQVSKRFYNRAITKRLHCDNYFRIYAIKYNCEELVSSNHFSQ